MKLVFSTALVTVTLFACQASLTGQEFSPFTKNEPPEFTTAMIKDGTIRFVEKSNVKGFQTEVVEVLVPKKRAVKKPVVVQVPYTIERNGKKETVYREETKFETVYETYLEKKLQQKPVQTTTEKMVLNEISLARQVFYFETVGGKKLTGKELLESLSKWTPAIIVRDGDKLSPYFRKVLNPETIVIFEQKREKRMKKTVNVASRQGDDNGRARLPPSQNGFPL